ncbi:glutathione S-transferase [Yoonia sp. 2307UL14-13]|uniref:glutathione S-transferase n=1 Tax=Yoonia sp. 2307UL14-13 TaxID=3126506 RepID=UPI0030A0BF87
MTYQIYIGDRTFSSWSLRGWLMLEKFGLDHQDHQVGLYTGTYRDELAHLVPARTVPAMQTPEGHVLSDSLAMAETLVERHPDIDLYPRDPGARALARSICAEMHSGFTALRAECPMIIRHRWTGFQPSTATLDDLGRIETLWALARGRHGGDGPWLFGRYSLADVFYAPVACRIIAYDLPVSNESMAYVQTHLQDPAFFKWRAASLSETFDPWPYTVDLPQKPWPGDPG